MHIGGLGGSHLEPGSWVGGTVHVRPQRLVVAWLLGYLVTWLLGCLVSLVSRVLFVERPEDSKSRGLEELQHLGQGRMESVCFLWVPSSGELGLSSSQRVVSRKSHHLVQIGRVRKLAQWAKRRCFEGN